MNTAAIKMTIKVHSVIDIITNSSSELFCTVKGENANDIEEIMRDILKDCGCPCGNDIGGEGMSVYPSYNEEGEEIDGMFDINFGYDTSPNCKFIRERIQALFTDVTFENN